MKTLRRSLNSNKDVHHNISAPVPVPQLQKPSTAIAPPKKVIKATDSYRSQAPQELSFLKGDFFYVTADPAPNEEWYQVHNPSTGSRGVVPRNLFEAFDKSNAA
jgi:bud emergence protein 1